MVSHDLAHLGETIIYKDNDVQSINNIIYFKAVYNAKI